MTLEQARKLAQHPGAFSAGDRWLILDGAGRPLESHARKTVAADFCDAVNQHEAKNGRAASYTVAEVSNA